MSEQIVPRTCANCCSYNEGECWNLVTFSYDGGPREQPTPADVCEAHRTSEEDQAEDAAIAGFRAACGLPARGSA